MRVAEASGGKGNSNGYRISYYNLGWLSGMVLDLGIRAETGGKKTLDDVEHALWAKCRNNKPGFDEGDIRKLYVQMGGNGQFYDRVIMQPGDLAIEETLAKAGLKVVTSKETYVDLGFTFGGGPGATALTVQTSKTALQPRDVIVAVNGTAISGSGRTLTTAMTAATKGAVAGTPMKVSILRDGQAMDIEVTPTSAIRDTYSVERVENATEEQKKLATWWLSHAQIK